MPVGVDKRSFEGSCNIASPRSEMIGRDEDLEAVLGLLEQARLVTIFGTAGIGKTRLSLHVGRAYHERASGRTALFIDWSVAEDLGALCIESARVLGARLPIETGDVGVWREVLAERLRAARGDLLLICDNVEHLIDEGFGVLEQWLDAAPRLRVLATSRERLRLDGERVYSLSPLSLPEGEASLAALEGSEAASLFVLRAREVGAAFVDDLEARDAAAQRLARDIFTIVRRLDGLPLAIELAAARASMLSPAQLAAQLPRELGALSRGRRGAQPRQATLEGAIDWSWNLLSVAEQRVFAQCAVFAAPFTLEAAEAVLVLEDEAVNISALLQSLVDRSLLRPRPEAGAIFFYEVLRAYALERLQEMPSRDALERRHARYFAAIADLAPQAEGRAALRHAVAHPHDPTWLAWGLAIITRLEDAWRKEGLSDDDQGLIDALLATTRTRGDLDPAVASRAWQARGNLHRLRGRLAEARADLEHAHALLDARDDPARQEQRARLLNDLGIVCHESGPRDDAVRCFEEARDAATALVARAPSQGAVTLLGQIFGSLAIVHQEQGQAGRAHRLYEHALEHLRRGGARREEAIFLCNLGDLYREEGRLVAARERYQRALELIDDLGDQRIRGVLLGNLGGVAQEEGALDEAEALRRQAIDALRDVGDDRLTAVFDGYLGATLHLRGDLDGASRHYERALRSLKTASDQRFLAIFSMYREVARAQRGEAPDAARRLADLAPLVATLGEPHLRSALAVHRAHVAWLLDAGPRPQPPAQGHDEVRFALALCRDAPPATAAPPAAAEAAAPDEAWIEVSLDGGELVLPDATRVDLRRRRAPRRILARLIEHLLSGEASAIEGLDLDALLEAGWPDEKIQPEAGANRVYVAIATLRSLGLHDALLTREGYLLDPARVRVLKSP